MADPLSLLRQFNVNKREIVERNNYICFGESCWPKNVKTNYLVWGSTKDGPNKKYYTLECLLFFLKNVHLTHAQYVKQAAQENIPVVNRPDRKDLLAYLNGETNVAHNIDKSAPIEIPISKDELLKAEGAAGSGSSQSAAAVDDEGPTPNKLSRLDAMMKAKEQLAARLDAPKIKKPIATPLSLSASAASGDGSGPPGITEQLSAEKIAALKAKRLAIKRGTIVDADLDLKASQQQGSSASAAEPSATAILRQYDSDFIKEVQTKERAWRNRSNVLQSASKNFGKSIFTILQSVKQREEGSKKPQPPVPTPSMTTPMTRTLAPPTVPLSQQTQYNRYDQERFSRNDANIGFRIDTMGTYHGLTLKNVTEGPATPKNVAPAAPTSNPAVAPSALPAPNKPHKRTSRTPIIIIPATTTALINMYNAKAILQDLRFMEGNTSQRRENELLVQRRKPDNTTVPYRVIDNPIKLLPEDWDRVVAVFVQGPAWQFKGWPYDGNPVEIFARIKAFHIKFDEMKLDTNVAKWNVEVIELSRNKRHLDRANLLKFWSVLDTFMLKYKHHLRF